MTPAIAQAPNALPAQLAAEKGGTGGATTLLLLVALMIFAYFILIRPQRARMKQLQQTQASLTPGAEVMTTAGLFATIIDFDDDTVTLETAPGVHNRYVRAAVARIVTPVQQPDEIDEDVDGEFDQAADGPADDDGAKH